MRLGLWILTSRRGLVVVLKKIGHGLEWSLSWVARLGWLVLFVKPYQLWRLSRRPREQISQILLPHHLGQQHWLSITMVIVTALGILVNNVNIRQVNAGDFGQRSLLITLVHPDLGELVEETSLAGTTSADSTSEVLRPETDVSTGQELTPGPATADEGSALIKPHLVTTERGIRREAETYMVEEGDTLSAIAAKFGVTVSTLLWENRLTSYSILRPGQKLAILPTSGVSYRVAKGDTLSRIASRYGVDVAKIKEFNGLEDTLTVGDVITIPGARPYVPPAPARPATTPAASFAPNLASNTKLLWPAPTRRISQYFSWRHTGVDLANSTGTPIYAADDGVVQTAGWNQGGYGNYIIIDHGQGLATLYGHNSKLLVSRGERVTRGQLIALMGSTGRSTGPHVHFEVRIGGRRVNPLTYIQ
ncbi:TPA: hypothetical protein DIC39_02280 [Patescibacteria group bacterium]|nr:hypothetical protein [Patescibacteria group bacterium]HCU47862.1 hypothetical protein [Patescibacteria group bacterium]